MNICTLTGIKQEKKLDLLSSTGNSSQQCGVTYMKQSEKDQMYTSVNCIKLLHT